MILLIFSLIVIFICKIIIKKNINEEINNYLKMMIKLVIISTILELSIFNFRHFESLNYNEIKLDNYTLGEGLRKNNDGSITLIEKENNYIQIEDIDEHINNIHIDVDKMKTTKITVGFGFTDKANRHYSYLKNQVLATDNINNGDTFRTHFSGSTRRLRIYLETSELEDTFKIKEISINRKVPYTITIIRPIIIIMAFFILYFFRPSSSIYRLNLFDKKAKKLIFLVLAIVLISFGLFSRLNTRFTKEKFGTLTRYQYHLLTEAFTKGQTYLDIEPSQILKDMSNPYDTKARRYKFEDTDEEYLWDVAFYNDRYYVYFGVAPVIIYFLPYYLVTGSHIKVSTCVLITTILTIIAIFYLLYMICKKWFKNIKLGHYLILTLTFICGSGLLYIIGRPDHYNLPIIMGVMFSLYGLICWLKAFDSKRTTLLLFLGSFLLASVAAARPQLLLTSFLVFPIFYNKVFKERKLFSKSSIKETIALVLPYMMVAIPLMIYNYVRFSSPFDFGANYNLTTNDMTKRGFVFDRIPLGLFYYLINPINLVTMFPFVMRTQVVTDYIGTTISEHMGAGFLVINFICLSCGYLFKKKKEFKDKMPYNIAILSIIFAFIIIIADTEMAGILPRYISDFGYLIYLATCIVLFNILSNNKNNKSLTKILYISFIVVSIYNILFMFSDSSLYNSTVFNMFRHLIAFWQ